MRRAARVDATQAEIVHALERSGCRVWNIREPVDLLAMRAGRLYLIECKSRRGSLTSAQERFLAEGWPVSVCWSAEDALRAVAIDEEVGL